jgi:hypothetical protein
MKHNLPKNNREAFSFPAQKNGCRDGLIPKGRTES